MANFPLKLGSQGDLVSQLDQKAVKRFSKIALEIDGVTPLKDDKYFGRGEQAFAQKWQINTGRPVTGQITEEEFDLIVGKAAAPIPMKMIPGAWMYTCPGSGANFDVGPSYEVGKWCEENLGIRHQPVYFQKGGYLGFMGGDPTFSYNDVIYDQYKSIEWLLDNNPDVQKAMEQLNAGVPVSQIVLDLWFSGYSQSADGIEDALEILFGDGGFKIRKSGEIAGPGKYRALRGFIRGIVQLGNPSRSKDGMTGVNGWQPAGWGISRKVRPDWIRRLVVSITNPGDFYAAVPDSDTIRPPFYTEIVEANISLPFFVHVLNLAVPIIAGAIPIFGGILGPMAPMIVAGLAGITNLMPLFSGLFGQAQQSNFDTEADKQIEAILTPMGVLTSIPALIGLIGSLPGLQKHGEYHLPQNEFGGRSGQQVGCDVVRLYYRK